MTVLAMSDYERHALYHLRCLDCRTEFESFDREDRCRSCDGPTTVFGLEERLLKLPQSA